MNNNTPLHAHLFRMDLATNLQSLEVNYGGQTVTCKILEFSMHAQHFELSPDRCLLQVERW